MVKWMDNLPKWAKVLLALPCLDVVWVIYRLVKSLGKKQTLGVVLAVILIVVGLPWLWLLDIITIILLDKVLWF
ncbi:MAG: hypothetical protein ACOYJ1_06520 [Peptococcales bacterium]|jgi:hypothetical protein|nr:hypothetical protein [Bacilli bacterium]HPK86139.1 hypothetical protein [Bacilli bacterium]